MDIDNCYKYIFNTTSIEKLELSINYKLKKIGYNYFLNCINRFSKVKTTDENIEQLSNYIFEYIKLIIVDNKYKFGRSEFLKNLKSNNSSKIIEKIINDRLNGEEIIKLMDILLLEKSNIINIFYLLEENENILKNIIKSNYWFMDNCINNMSKSYLGQIINNKTLYIITNELLINLVCEWMFKLIKLEDFEEKSSNFINVLSFFFNYLDNKLINYDNYIQDIENIEFDKCNMQKNIFNICYIFFNIGIINNINEFFELKKNIKNIDNKLINIYSNDKINNIKRIQIITENQIKKNNLKKQKKILETSLNNKKDDVINYCIYICEILLNNNIINNNKNGNIIKNFTYNLINILKFYHINSKIIFNYIFKVLQNVKNIEIEIICIEYLVNYIQIYTIEDIDKNILNKLFSIFIKSNETKLTKYELYEPRYYILYIIKYINNYIFSIEDYILLNIDNFNTYIRIILNDLAELFYEIIYYFDKLSNIFILSNNKNELNDIINILETFITFFKENIEQIYILSNNNKIISKFDKFVYNKICNILFHNLKKIVSNIDTYIYIIDTYNINFNLADFLIKINLIIFNFNKNEKLLLEYYKLEYDYNLLNDMKEILFQNQIISWTIFYKLNELQINYNKYIAKNKKSLNSKFLDPLLFTEITNPIILPNSNIIINFETIKQHLENSKTDPFDRTYLTIEILLEYNKKNHVIELVNKFIQEKNENCK